MPWSTGAQFANEPRRVQGRHGLEEGVLHVFFVLEDPEEPRVVRGAALRHQDDLAEVLEGRPVFHLALRIKRTGFGRLRPDFVECGPRSVQMCPKLLKLWAVWSSLAWIWSSSAGVRSKCGLGAVIARIWPGPAQCVSTLNHEGLFAEARQF